MNFQWLKRKNRIFWGIMDFAVILFLFLLKKGVIMIKYLQEKDGWFREKTRNL